MRPKAIVTFERLFLLSILLSTVQLALRPPVASQGVPASAQIGVSVAMIFVSVALVLATSRRRSNVARWVLTVFAGVSIFWTGYGIGQALAAGRVADGLPWVDLLGVALQTAAVAALWTRPARDWFGHEGGLTA